MNEAAIVSARNDKTEIGYEEIDFAIDRQTVGMTWGDYGTRSDASSDALPLLSLTSATRVSDPSFDSCILLADLGLGLLLAPNSQLSILLL